MNMCYGAGHEWGWRVWCVCTRLRAEVGGGHQGEDMCQGSDGPVSRDTLNIVGNRYGWSTSQHYSREVGVKFRP